MKFEQALKSMREGKELKTSRGIWKYRLLGRTFQFSSIGSDCWTKFPHFPCFLVLSEDWEIIDD